jgi:hypothetical protein
LQYECAKAAGCDIEVVSTIDYAQQFIEDENN